MTNMTKVQNKYGYGLTKAEMNALRWANDKLHGDLSTSSFFIVREGWKRYAGMGRGTPTVSVRKLLEKGMIYKDEFGGKLVSDRTTGPLEVYRLTERAIHVLAQHGGYKLPDGQTVVMKS